MEGVVFLTTVQRLDIHMIGVGCYAHTYACMDAEPHDRAGVNMSWRVEGAEG
jgi:hypothetical protein